MPQVSDKEAATRKEWFPSASLVFLFASHYKMVMDNPVMQQKWQLKWEGTHHPRSSRSREAERLRRPGGRGGADRGVELKVVAWHQLVGGGGRFKIGAWH